MKFTITFLLLFLFFVSPSQNLPFPQNRNINGIKPNHKTDAELSFAITKLYDTWKSKFLKPTEMEGGYYVKGECTGCEVASKGTSEGHGYGMLITALMAGYDSDAKIYFDGLYHFFDNYRSVINNELMNWNVAADERDPWTDSASDGDMDIAYALLLAHYQWGSDGDINYLQEAVDMINNGIKAGDMSTVSKRVMLGDWDNNKYTTRSSDWMTDHFRAYKDATNDTFWDEAADSVYSFMNQIITKYSSNTGLLPDFMVGSPIKPSDPNFLEDENDGDYYYNACRFPWRIASDYIQYGTNESKNSLSKLLQWANGIVTNGFENFKAGYTLDGTALENYDDLSFIAPLVVAFTTDATYQNTLNEGWDYIENECDSYFDGSLNLLSQLMITGNWWAPVQNNNTNTAPNINLASPQNNQQIMVGENAVFTFSGNDITKIKKVTFYINNNEIGNVTESPFTFNYKVENEGITQIKTYVETTDNKARLFLISIEGILDKETAIGGKIVGYFPSWSGNVNDIQFDKLTHINYSFLLPKADGSLKPIENSSKLTSLVTACHQNDVETAIAIGGWNNGDDSAFETIAADEDLIKTFVSNVMNFIRQYSLDGVDIDWEYPNPGESATNYSNMMSVFADSLHAANKTLTTAVAGKEWSEVSYPESIFPMVDWVNIMAYDNFDAQNHSTLNYAKECVNYWKNTKNLPKEKTVLGVPFYGYSPYKAYKDIVAEYPDAPNSDHAGSYYYNGKNTMHLKAEYAKENCAGIMIWEISQDTKDKNTSLLTVIYKTYKGVYTQILNNQEKNDIIIYPNPATDFINIDLQELNRYYTINILDSMGQVVKTINIEPNKKSFSINISNLTPGIYFLQINDKTSKRIIKVVKL